MTTEPIDDTTHADDYMRGSTPIVPVTICIDDGPVEGVSLPMLVDHATLSIRVDDPSLLPKEGPFSLVVSTGAVGEALFGGMATFEVPSDADFEEVGDGPFAGMVDVDSEDPLDALFGGVVSAEDEQAGEPQADDLPVADPATRVAAAMAQFDPLLASLTQTDVPDRVRLVGTAIVEGMRNTVGALLQEAYARVPDGPTFPAWIVPQLLSNDRGWWLAGVDESPSGIWIGLRIPDAPTDGDPMDFPVEIRTTIGKTTLGDLAGIFGEVQKRLPKAVAFGETKDPKKFAVLLGLFRQAGVGERKKAKLEAMLRAARNLRRRQRRAAKKQA